MVTPENLATFRGLNFGIRTLQQQAFTIRKKVFGMEHPLVASDLNNLASLLNDQASFKIPPLSCC